MNSLQHLNFAAIVRFGIMKIMAFTSSRDILLSKAQHAASVLALSFSGMDVKEAPKDGEFRGNFLAVPRKPILYLGKAIMFYFNTGTALSSKGENTLIITQCPIEWTHAKLAPRIVAKLPELLPIIHLKLKELGYGSAEDEDMERELDDPCVTLNSGDLEASEWNQWTFEVYRPDNMVMHYVKFKDFEVIDSYTVS